MQQSFLHIFTIFISKKHTAVSFKEISHKSRFIENIFNFSFGWNTTRIKYIYNSLIPVSLIFTTIFCQYIVQKHCILPFLTANRIFVLKKMLYGTYITVPDIVIF